MKNDGEGVSCFQAAAPKLKKAKKNVLQRKLHSVAIIIQVQENSRGMVFAVIFGMRIKEF